MNKQEEIREGIKANILVAIKWAVSEGMTDPYLDLHVDKVLKLLHSQGVVIKVDRELPDYEDLHDCYDGKLTSPEQFKHDIQMDMLKAGYVAVEPLIGGE